MAKETLGESRGFSPRGKYSWWWKESVHSKVRVKMTILKFGLGVKMSKRGKSRRKLRMRPRSQ